MKAELEQSLKLVWLKLVWLGIKKEAEPQLK
jgi:hypothetical protein